MVVMNFDFYHDAIEYRVSVLYLDYQRSSYDGIVRGGALVFRGGYHARVQKHRKKGGFQGEACTARPVFRVSKMAKIKKKGMFFRLIKKYKKKVCFHLLQT